jgi:hypothetical protein
MATLDYMEPDRLAVGLSLALVVQPRAEPIERLHLYSQAHASDAGVAPISLPHVFLALWPHFW